MIFANEGILKILNSLMKTIGFCVRSASSQYIDPTSPCFLLDYEKKPSAIPKHTQNAVVIDQLRPQTTPTETHGSIYTGPINITVLNANDAPLPNPDGPYNIGKGQLLALNGSATDEDAGQSFVYEWDMRL